MALVEDIDVDAVRLSEANPGDYFALLKPRVMSLVVFTASDITRGFSNAK